MSTDPIEGRKQNKMIFVAITFVIPILFVIFYLIKTNQFNFLDHPVLTKILRVFNCLTPGVLVPGRKPDC